MSINRNFISPRCW